MYSDQQPRIAIIGGGPAGLSLGALLHKRGITFSLYELRDKPASSSMSAPSGMLDLHEDGGLRVIRSCGLYEKFIPLTNECTQECRIIDHDGNTLFSEEDDTGDRPEISRNALSSLLLPEVPENSTFWGYKLLKSSRAENGRIVLDFGAKGIIEFDLVVGTDGAWSKMRHLVTDVKPFFSGICYLAFDIYDVINHPTVADVIGGGTCYSVGPGCAIVSQRGPHESARIYIYCRSDDEDIMRNRLQGLSRTEIKDTLLGNPEMFATWSDSLRQIINMAFDEGVSLPSSEAPELLPHYMLPVGHTWETRPGVTLAGDSAHLMTPWAGQGVNMAMGDSVELAEAIANGCEAFEREAAGSSFQDFMVPWIAEYEAGMFKRTEPAARETLRNTRMVFGEDGARGLATLMEGFRD